MLRAVAYKSRAKDGLTIEQVDQIGRRSDAFNKIAGVTGILLYDGVSFFQYLEGPPDGIDAVLGKVTGSAWHEGMEMLMSQPASKRRVPYWSMTVRSIRTIDLGMLIGANWAEASQESAGVSGIEWLTGLALVRSSPLDRSFTSSP